MQVALKVTCVSSFPDVPHLQLSYSQQGQQVAQNLMLPIVVSKFCTPPDNPVPKEVFFSRWRAIAGQLFHAWHGDKPTLLYVHKLTEPQQVPDVLYLREVNWGPDLPILSGVVMFTLITFSNNNWLF